MYKGTLLILGFNVENSTETLNYKQIQNNFPAELDLCGLVKFGLCSDSQAHLNDILQVRHGAPSRLTAYTKLFCFFMYLGCGCHRQSSAATL